MHALCPLEIQFAPLLERRVYLALNSSYDVSIFSCLHTNLLIKRKSLLLVFFVFSGILTPRFFLQSFCAVHQDSNFLLASGVQEVDEGHSAEYLESRNLDCKHFCYRKYAMSFC